MVDCSILMIPLVNEMFGTHFPDQSYIRWGPSEHVVISEDGKQLKRHSDSLFRVCYGDRKSCYFALECQAKPDKSMVFRMYEYLFMEGRELARQNRDVLNVRLPQTGVLYLRASSKTPDAMTIRLISGRERFHIPICVLKITDYQVEDVFSKKLYFLLPFYIFHFEKDFDKYESGERDTAELKGIYEDIWNRLETAVTQGGLSEYHRLILIQMMSIVIDAITANRPVIREGVSAVMGGKVLDYPVKQSYKEGVADGEEKLGILVKLLIDHGKISDMERVTEDKAYRQRLYKEYGIK